MPFGLAEALMAVTPRICLAGRPEKAPIFAPVRSHPANPGLEELRKNVLFL
jgi:hypothetical protein